jgi:flagellar biosynthesis protein FlhF
MLKRHSAAIPAPGTRIFEGKSIFEAYSKLKRALGDDAVILKTKHITKGGWLGMGGQRYIQITASEPAFASSESQASSPVPIAQRNSPSPPQSSSSAPASQTEMFNAFQADLREIREMIQGIQQNGGQSNGANGGGSSVTHPSVEDQMPEEFQKAFQKLKTFNISEDIAKALIQRWQGHYPNFQKGQKVDLQLLQQYISDMLIPAGPIQLQKGRPTVVMLVGPTGVGKTTSIAKLAARYKIQRKKNVALITIDTYRIAAVEQLRTYADLIGVPLKVIDHPSALKEALASFSDRDLILVDSAGRSPRNVDKMDELQSYVDASKADELHLVLSMSVSPDVMEDTLKRYRNFPVSKLLFTKLDEAVHYGSILGVLNKTQKPIGYITTGQEVPDDIEVATQERLARLILKLDKVSGG